MPIIVQLVLVAIIAYLWGSIPAGYWMGKLLRGKDFDIRDYGSHKIGATNVLRTLGKGPAAFYFSLIFQKVWGQHCSRSMCHSCMPWVGARP